MFGDAGVDVVVNEDCRLFYRRLTVDSQAERTDQRDLGVAGGRVLPIGAAVCTNTWSYRGGRW